MSVNLESSNHKGAIAEAEVAAAAIELGIPVLKPMSEHGRYDLVFEVGDRLLKIQCKWARRKGAVVVVTVSGNYLTPHGYVRSPYTAAQIDAIVAYCGNLDRVYLLPAELVVGKHMVHLRLSQPTNGQRAGLNWASDFEFPGAVAQLERASGRQPEGRGFESHQLHSPEADPKRAHVVGAHEFRNHFGLYMQRAAAGEEFHVTRRGKPHVRLLGPQPSLDLS